MATNTGSRALIGFLKDYNEKEPWPTRTYQVTRDGGLSSNKPVGIAHGESWDFLLVETFDRLEVIRRAVAAGWNGPRRFEARNVWPGRLSQALEGWSAIVTQILRTRLMRTTKNCAC